MNMVYTFAFVIIEKMHKNISGIYLKIDLNKY
jgi:hypothetical protein